MGGATSGRNGDGAPLGPLSGWVSSDGNIAVSFRHITIEFVFLVASRRHTSNACFSIEVKFTVVIL